MRQNGCVGTCRYKVRGLPPMSSAAGKKGRGSMKAYRSLRLTVLTLLEVGILAGGAEIARANVPPVAKAGLSRYAGPDPIRLDGSGSYDPDHSGPLTYAWRQISGPAVVITDANTATPLISGPNQTDRRGKIISTRFVQTDAIQECDFELVVSDGELSSKPDTVKVVIVPAYGMSSLQLENPPFDPNKPTFLFFTGGDCTNGGPGGTGSIPIG